MCRKLEWQLYIYRTFQEIHIYHGQLSKQNLSESVFAMRKTAPRVLACLKKVELTQQNYTQNAPCIEYLSTFTINLSQM